MKAEDFNQIVKRRLEACTAMLVPKGEEYARNGDRLHNFKAAGRMKDESPEQALWGMYAKHLVSVVDMISDAAQGKLPSQKLLDEKISDSINYHLLLEGLIMERKMAELGEGAE
jgi:hypothetical protein